MHSVIFGSNKQWIVQLTLATMLALLVTPGLPVLAQVSVTCPPDMTVSNDPGVCSAVVEFPNPVVTGTNAADIVSITPPSGSTFLVGTNEVVVDVTNGGTNLANCGFLVIVEDAEPPAMTDVSANKTMLWPPNHKMVNVVISYQAIDNCNEPAPECTLSVTSNEPVDGTGDGNTSPDWIVVDAHRVKLRAERSGQGDGRIYTITITCTDASGNSSSEDVTVIVPHSRGRGNNGGGNGNGNGQGNGHGHGHKS